nr:hypothetical protein [Candidatus Sigynarchaeum springense]
MTSPDERTGLMPGDAVQPIEMYTCEFCHEFKTDNPRGLSIHRGKCSRATKRDAVAARPAKAPVTLGSSIIKDPVLARLEGYEQLVAAARKAGFRSITIEKDGDEWHVDARWKE